MVDAIIREIDITPGKRIRRITSVYFGGGTPSILLGKELRALMETVRTQFQVMPGAETTFEVNPDDMNATTLPFWKQQGINRLSIGIQSFRDEDLAWMNRDHSAAQALAGIELARKEGFSNYSIDLIYGVPGMDDDAWRANLARAIDLEVPHISAYSLTVEPKTALSTLIEKGDRPPVDANQQARQFLIAMDMLGQAGYEHYEISNFARPGMRSRHNSSYWSGVPYFGFGPGAHSFNGQARYWNVSHNARYIQSLMQGVIPYEKEELTETQMLNEYIMTSLRTIEGLDLARVRSNWGEEKAETLRTESAKHVNLGRLILRDKQFTLTREGKLFADGIAADLFFLDPRPGNRPDHSPDGEPAS
jgi:oxygen-independent coproporphyrinogen-3 oxidase